MKREVLEFRIGLFVVVGLALLVLMVFAFGERHLFRHDYEVIGYFSGSVGNVTKGAPVRLAGVDIGRAADIKLDKKGNVRAHLRIYDEFTIKEDAPLLIKQDGILGEHYFEFGSGSEGARPLPKTGVAVVKGVVQTSMGDLPPKLSQLLTQYEPKLAEVLDNLNKTITGLNTVIADPQTQAGVRAVVRSASETLARGPVVADKLEQALTEANATIKGARVLIDRLNATADSVAALVAGAKAQMAELGKYYGALANDLRGLSSKMEVILNSMQRLAADAKAGSTVGRLLTEDKLYQKLVEALDEARTTLAQVKQTFRYLEENPTALYWGDKSRHKVTDQKPWWQRILTIGPTQAEEEAGQQPPKEAPTAPADQPK